MIKPKAPKDRTVEEFIDLVEARYHTENPTNMNSWINTLRMIADEPAPNPFTPDQLAWMREEQRNGIKYAAMRDDGVVVFFDTLPVRPNGYWGTRGGFIYAFSGTFLSKFLSKDDTEPLCFADYAPLTSPCEGGEKE